jgi:hypothetical protein
VPLDHDTDHGGGWRHDPRVAYAAVGVILLMLIIAGVRCIGCRGREIMPTGFPERHEQGIVLICPHDQTQYTVTPSDVRKIEGGGRFAAKALRVPCPQCGRTDSVQALPCPKCGKYYSPVADGDGTPTTTCPHCGASVAGQ